MIFMPDHEQSEKDSKSAADDQAVPETDKRIIEKCQEIQELVKQRPAVKKDQFISNR